MLSKIDVNCQHFSIAFRKCECIESPNASLNFSLEYEILVEDNNMAVERSQYIYLQITNTQRLGFELLANTVFFWCFTHVPLIDYCGTLHRCWR